METSITVSAGFDAAHSIGEEMVHGHHWDVYVEVSGNMDPKTGWPVGTEKLPTQLEGLATLLTGRSLDTALPGTTTSPLGIAMVILDRLSGRQPNITQVRAVCSDGTEGTVRRPLRQL